LTLNKNLQALRRAVLGIEENEELKHVIIMILKIGNYLNQGSNKGNATNFNVDLLKSMNSTKAVGEHSKSTMLDFLLSSLLTKSPGSAKFALKLEGCKEAGKLEMELLTNSLKAFKAQQA